MVNNLSLLSNAKSYSISHENRTGARGKGGMDIPTNEDHPAYDLGQTWKVSPFVEIEAGETFEMANIEGAGAIQSMWMTGYIGKGLILRIYWDDQEVPSVECPFNDFFVSGWIDNDYTKTPFGQVNSIPMSVNPANGLNCFFEMPFLKRCRITLENRTKKTRTVYYQINYTLSDDMPENIGYFHAQYRESRPVPYKGVHTILDNVKAKGHYVGTVLYVGLNRSPRWWGEGEIKFFIDDDDKFPTICGTGLEDYFGGSYNWDIDGEYIPYSGPFMGMPNVIRPDGTYNIQMRYTLYRFHLPDPIRFDTDLKVTIQALGWKADNKFLSREDDYISVAYWYQELPTQPFPPLPPQSQFDEDVITYQKHKQFGV